MITFNFCYCNSCLFLLSSYGQNLSTSTFIGETSFSILIAILGLILFAHLIGNMQVNEKIQPVFQHHTLYLM